MSTIDPVNEVDARVSAAADTFLALAQALMDAYSQPPRTSLLRYQEEMTSLVLPLLASAIDLADALSLEIAMLKDRVDALESRGA